MPLYSEHISNMYYSGTPSYTSPSYGYKSSYNPLGTSYSASYLSPGGSYSNHSSLSSYSRAPLSSRWIPGMSRSYSPMLTPISERGTASPLRINSPRRIPIAKRCYGTPSYIQRPININTESIDVSRDRYRSKPAEPSPSASLPRTQNDNPLKENNKEKNENSPFMPRVDGKPETGIDSSPGIQRSTIKRGRTVVRLHTIKRKDKDSPRKPLEISQLLDDEKNKQVATAPVLDDVAPEEPKESLSWREKLSDDLVYVEKKEKKSLGTKLVEKFILKDVNESNSKIDKSDMRGSELQTLPKEVILPSNEVPSTSKSPDRRCSMEFLAEQSSLLDSLIRGENLSTATLDLSKIGISEETKNKFASSDSIKRRKTDGKGNPLKTTKSDHSLHENLKKSLKGNKDSKVFTKRQSLKKSQSGGSICRLDSITELPKEPVHIDLPAIQENKFSPKETKTEQKPKLRTKITASVEISPPTSPLKFRIENITVEEKLHTPKKEISFSYDLDETPIQDVTLQGPKSTLRRTKERNSIRKKTRNTLGTDPISPEPDDGNFWAKIGKRETVYLMKRKQNLEAAREENKKSHFWIQENEELEDYCNDTITNNSISLEKNDEFLNQAASSDMPFESERSNIITKIEEVKDEPLKSVLNNLEKSKSSDNIQKVEFNTYVNTSLKEKSSNTITEPKYDDNVHKSNKSSKKIMHRQDAEIIEDATDFYEEKNEMVKTTNSNLRLIESNADITTPKSEKRRNLETSETVHPEISNIVSVPKTKPLDSEEIVNVHTYLGNELKQKSNGSAVKESFKSKDILNYLSETTTQEKTTSVKTAPIIKAQAEIEVKSLEKVLKPETNIIEINATKKVGFNISPEISTQSKTVALIAVPALKSKAKCEGKSIEKDSIFSLEKNDTIEVAEVNIDVRSSENSTVKIAKITPPTTQPQSKSRDRSLEKDILEKKAKAKADVNLSPKTLPEPTPVNTDSSKDILEKNDKIEKAKAKVDVNLSPKTLTEIKRVNTDSTKDILEINKKIEKANAKVEVNLSPKTLTEIKPVNTDSPLQCQAKSDCKGLKDVSQLISEQSVIIDVSKHNRDLNLPADTKPQSVNTRPTIQTLNMKEDLDLMPNSEKSEIIKNNGDVNLSAETTTELKEKVNSESALQSQAKCEVKDKKTEPFVTSVADVNKQMISESTKKSMPTTEANSKKKVKKVQVKILEKDKDMKIEKTSSPVKDKICVTCKKSLGSDDSKTSTLNVTRVADSSTSKPMKEKDKAVKRIARADKPMNDLQKSKSDLCSSLANSSDSNAKPETSASTSQIPIVIQTKNIPNETVSCDEEQVKISVSSQEKTGEVNKAEKVTKGDESSKVKQPSIKEVAKLSPKKKKEIKEEKPAKPLIATPRPLAKRAPQVINSDSSESSSEEESSEEESDASENSADFYECETNPDGRTSTGSNDSGFDSSAPNSPASFLQIKKDCDVNCHRKCEKLTANLCGVNQRLLVEALATRTASKKGGGDSPGPSSSNASSQLPANDVDDSELDLEQSTAYGIFRKTGRFTPPARSIPRFRKYNIEDFQFIKVLGKGSFGKVLLAELRDTEYYYAVKCLKKDVVLEDDDVECTLIERKVLALGTNHPYLCHLFATFQTDSHLFFVMEYLNGGDLMFHIQQSGRFPEPRARFYAGEIVSGLKFLHKRGIVYRDLKLDNILLDFDGHVRIADFGMCKLQIYLDKTADTFCGTPDYMAPEIIKGQKYNQTVDWWSFGVLLYEMLIGQSPFSGCDEDELFWSICNEMPSYPRFLSREALTILTRLLDKDARTRLGGTECMHGDVREQEFFHHIHWDKLERRELETPFKPRVRHPLDTQYFDRAFTGERPRLTAVEPHVLRSMDQEPFRGFSYTNPNATDR